MHALTVAMALLLATPASGRQASPYPQLDKDPHLRRHITVSKTDKKVRDVLSQLSKETGVEITAEGDYLNQTVLTELKDREAREVMTDIGITAKATWIK